MHMRQRFLSAYTCTLMNKLRNVNCYNCLIKLFKKRKESLLAVNIVQIYYILNEAKKKFASSNADEYDVFLQKCVSENKELIVVSDVVKS